jgi:hypothetical protein
MVPQEGDLDPVEVSMIAMGGRAKRSGYSHYENDARIWI